MASSNRIWGWILRPAAVVVGVAILVLATPRLHPWGSFHLPDAPYGLLAGLALIAAVAAVAVACGYGGAARGRAAAVAVTVLLFLSMIPASTRGRGVTLSLWAGLAGVLLVTAGVAGASVRRRFESGRLAMQERLGRVSGWRLAGTASLFVLLVSLAGSIFMLGRIPHIVDAAAQLFHAKIFLSGSLWAPTPETAGLFEFTHMIQQEGRWYSQYPPGHIGLLAVGLLVGAPWLVNPLLAACLPLLCYPLGRELFGESAGRWAAVSMALSPFVWLLASSFMSHTPMLFFFALFLLAYVRTVQHGRWTDACLAGLALGCAASVRPMTAAAVAVPFLAHALVRLVQSRSVDGIDRRRFAICCLLAGVALALPLAGLLGFNQATNGAPLRFGYEAAGGKEALPGFGHGGFWNKPHTPQQGWIATQNHLNGLNQYLFGLSIPALFLPLVGLLWMRPRLWEGLLLASCGCLLAAHFIYWYQDWVYGPRFMHAAVLPLVLLTARTLVALPAALEKRFPGRQAPAWAGLLLIVALIQGFAFQIPSYAAFYARNYEDGNAAVVTAVGRAGLSNAVVLVPDLYWPSFFARNDPALTGTVIFARELDAASTRRLVEQYQQRQFYRVRSFDDYVVQPYEEGSVGYTLDPGRPFIIEGLTFQLSHFKGAGAGNRQTGSIGAQWKNHDQLWVAGGSPAAEVGFLFDSASEQQRKLTLALTRSPMSGTIGIWLNGQSLGQVDLNSTATEVERVTFDAVPIRQGANPLLLRALDDHPFGLDYIRFD